MNSGIYTAYSGIRAQLDALDSLANNLANASTTGFKEDRAFFSVLDEAGNRPSGDALSDAINNHGIVGRAALDVSDGLHRRTDQPLDVALSGSGFIVVDAAQGTRYTRNGNLTLNAKAQLATQEGFPVLGEKGAIRLGPGRIEISSNGDVYLDRVRVDRLKLVAVDSPAALEREGRSLFALRSGAAAPTAAARIEVKQGYLEESNVNPVMATVRMVEVLRHFEALHKSVNLIVNEMDAKSIERLGR